MAMDSRFHKVEPMLSEKTAHGQPTARLGTVKNRAGLFVGPRLTMRNGLQCYCFVDE